ncbi:TIGR02444 family protein [Aquisalimonas sp. 2447]|uniref:TIGR02444 family protein n=1 Tax=Aquisalimonas sp. 2447 TaxID=2740807 RepID=UPI0014328045|nr:TIGR02444 family protein [Aquisalimonas sp. 2447]QIT53857.1 TIGR02444 family protein [Aquisalimonas sp. 2447]
MNAPSDLNPDHLADSAWAALARMYGQPGVKETVLALQDNNGVCVTALLTLLWSAANGHGPASLPTVTAVVAESESLEADLLRPYRRARNGLRHRATADTGAAELRRRLLDQELELERYLQTRVLAMLAPGAAREAVTDPDAAVETVLTRYLDCLGVTDNAADDTFIRVLRDAVGGE